MNTKNRIIKPLITGVAALMLLAGCASAPSGDGDNSSRGDGTDGVPQKQTDLPVSKTGGLTDGMPFVEFDFINGQSARTGEAIRIEIPEVILKDSKLMRQTITKAYTITSVETDKLGLCAVAIDVEYRDGADMSLRDLYSKGGSSTVDPDLGAAQSITHTYNLKVQKTGAKPTEAGYTISPDYSSLVVADKCPTANDDFYVSVKFRGPSNSDSGKDFQNLAEFDVTVNSEGTIWASASVSDDNTRNYSFQHYELDSTGSWMPK